MSEMFEDTGEPEGVLRVNIAGRWEAEDFSKFFTELEILNEMADFGGVRIDGQTRMGMFFYGRTSYSRYWRDEEFEWEVQAGAADQRLRHFLREASGEHWPLRVKQIEFASPGFTDLGGIGKVVREVRIFVMAIVDRFIERPDRALARAEKHQSIVSMKIANAERLMKLSDKAGLDLQTRTELIRRAIEADRYIEDMVINRRITSVDPGES